MQYLRVKAFRGRAGRRRDTTGREGIPNTARFRDAMWRLAVAFLTLFFLTLVDPLDVKSGSSTFVRDGLLRITRTIAPADAIPSWSDPRVRPTAEVVARELMARKKRIPPSDVPTLDEETLNAVLPKWTPIHVFLYDELVGLTGRSQKDLDNVLTSLPLNDLTKVFRAFYSAGVSVIYLDTRIVNDMSYDANFCADPGGIVNEWKKWVQTPGDYAEALSMQEKRGAVSASDADEFHKPIKKPILLLAGHAPLSTPRTSAVLIERDGRNKNQAADDSGDTVLPCLRTVGEVLQTDWPYTRGSYPLTVSRHYSPWSFTGTGEQEDYVYTPAMRMIQIWCKHHRSVIRDLDTCNWLAKSRQNQRSFKVLNWADDVVAKKSEGQEFGQFERLVPDWVHLTPAIYTTNEGKIRCSFGEHWLYSFNEEMMRQDVPLRDRWPYVFADAVEQAFLQLLQPVGRSDYRVTANTCFLPPNWPGFLSSRHGPWRANNRVRPALYGSAVILGGAFENLMNWNQTATAGQVPSAMIHATALQSLMWRGEDYVRDTNGEWDKLSVDGWAGNHLFWLEAGCIALAIFLYSGFRRYGAGPELQRFVLSVAGAKTLNPAFQRKTVEAWTRLFGFTGVVAIAVVAAAVLSDLWLHLPIPDAIAVVFCIFVAYWPPIRSVIRTILCNFWSQRLYCYYLFLILVLVLVAGGVFALKALLFVLSILFLVVSVGFALVSLRVAFKECWKQWTHDWQG